MKTQGKHTFTIFVILSILLVVTLLSVPVIYYAIVDPDLLPAFIESPTDNWWWKYYYFFVLGLCLVAVIVVSRKKFRDS